jgi:hypothetical protein
MEIYTVKSFLKNRLQNVHMLSKLIIKLILIIS